MKLWSDLGNIMNLFVMFWLSSLDGGVKGGFIHSICMLIVI
jgi:hypothetical protein